MLNGKEVTEVPRSLAAILPLLLPLFLAQTAVAQTSESSQPELLQSSLAVPGEPSPVLSVFDPYATAALFQPSSAFLTQTVPEEEVKWYQSTGFKRTIAPATLITIGLFTFKDEGFLNRQEVRDWRETFIPEFEDHTDDYTQFTSGLLALGLNAFGVKGTSKFWRATVTYAGGLGIMMVTIHSIKELTEVKRPDGSSNNSFPSGHTAASFASARFLDREYGHVSYLYSLAGYTMAAYTGVMRQLNNRHWETDVLVGAGIGMLSTDLAYVLMDNIFGDKGKNPPREPKPEGPRGNPSFLDYRLGYARQVSGLEDRGELFTAENGWQMGIEGAFFFNDYIGVGGELSVTGFPIDDSNFIPEDPVVIEVTEEINTQPFGNESLFIGPFFHLPLGERFGLNGKLTGGWSNGAQATINAQLKPEYQEEFGVAEVPIAVFDPKDTFGFAAGVAIRAMVSKRIGIRLFGEYNYSSPDYQISSLVSFDQEGNPEFGPVEEVVNVDFSYMAAGLSVSAVLW
ncbi:MAG: hypothetical protein AMS21_10430 [Gemmatimonas sp. SG8_38_2]|nr:MAG: hypothetical protein AMS21_10430 [Gemmatimonas sp. SG8_38_2]